MEEVWKDIDGTGGQYKISNLGRIRSFKLWRGSNDKILNPSINSFGYRHVELPIIGKLVSFTVHSLVAHHFIGFRPTTYLIHHIDGNKLNNNVTNLMYMSYQEHIQHEIGRDIIQYDLDNNIIEEYPSIVSASRKTGIAQRNIWSVINKKEYKPGKVRKTAGGYFWTYKDERVVV